MLIDMPPPFILLEYPLAEPYNIKGAFCYCNPMDVQRLGFASVEQCPNLIQTGSFIRD
ncbi:hypothetical protein VAE151_630866 [Vibrio aestuarianus]|nr:hypothetical protein VAE151_630866 [Vibrio aestuarianus]